MKSKPKLSDVSEWLNERGEFSVAVTINLKKRHPLYGIWISEDIAAQTAMRFVRHLWRYVLKRRYRYGHEGVNAIATLERGAEFRRWHIHLALEKPTNCSDSAFQDAIRLVASRLEWCRDDIDIQKYNSSGWLSYITKDGLDSIVVLDISR
jgi:hypothetical protein